MVGRRQKYLHQFIGESSILSHLISFFCAREILQGSLWKILTARGGKNPHPTWRMARMKFPVLLWVEIPHSAL
ncbi:hypothetical protein Sjap_005693 [Stephania japonica]|uniref:Uncharacterized protein n=1 Tax=Stephania japonica TaxID=461633 RepID=A0AAP0K5N5_9MAGN